MQAVCKLVQHFIVVSELLIVFFSCVSLLDSNEDSKSNDKKQPKKKIKLEPKGAHSHSGLISLKKPLDLDLSSLDFCNWKDSDFNEI